MAAKNAAVLITQRHNYLFTDEKTGSFRVKFGARGRWAITSVERLFQIFESKSGDYSRKYGNMNIREAKFPLKLEAI